MVQREDAVGRGQRVSAWGSEREVSSERSQGRFVFFLCPREAAPPGSRGHFP